jgi:hypothetical protein
MLPRLGSNASRKNAWPAGAPIPHRSLKLASFRVRRFLGASQEFLRPPETRRSQSLCKRFEGSIRCVPGEPSTTKTRIGTMTTTDFYILAAPLQSDQELTEEPRRIAIKEPSFAPSVIQQRLARPGSPCAPNQISCFNGWYAR